MISEGLKINTSLTQLDLSSEEKEREKKEVKKAKKEKKMNR